MTTFVRRFCPALVVALAVAVVGLAPAADMPETPNAAELKEAVDALKDAFEKDYTAADKDAKAKTVLARKLFDGAPKRKTPALRYASYDQARRLAAAGGDVKLALDALGAINANFRDVPPDLATDTLKALAAADLAPDAAAGLFGLARDATDDALQRGEYKAAVELGKLLVAAAKKAEDPDVLIDARKLLARLEGLASAFEVIKTKPNDPAANEALGRYWAFTRGRWDTGLKHLAKSPNKELAGAAGDDLRGPATAAGCAAVADAWYKLAKEHTGAERLRLAERAWEWYSAALALAPKEEVAERVKEIEKTYPDLATLKFDGHTDGAAAVALTPDGKTLVSVGNDKTVRIWDPATGKLLRTLEGHSGWVGSVVITPDGTHAITAGGSSRPGNAPPCDILVWDLKAQKVVRQLDGHTVAVRGLALTADGKTLVSGGGDLTCRTWDWTTGKELKKYGSGKESIESVTVTPDGKHILAGTDVGTVVVFDAKTGEVVTTFDKHGGAIVYTVAVTADGKTALSAARGKDARAWEIATGKELQKFTGQGEQVYQLALSRDGRYVVSAGSDKTVRVWDFDTGKQLKEFTGHTAPVQGACFSADGRTVFSASWDKSVRRWRLPMFPAGAKKVD